MKNLLLSGLLVLTLAACSYDGSEPKPLNDESFNEVVLKSISGDSTGGQTGNPPPPPPFP